MDYMNTGKIDLIINIPKTAEQVELDHDYEIRRKAIDLNISLITNIQIAKRFVKALSLLKVDEMPVKSWSEYN